ncbi:Thymidylate synthase [Ignavibacterium album JCM 16511]|uniref:Thymidylate synthase n=1 Tax=Ignavibacterium album (strain DSM 19864 / JCM 16511 / NBRC 101810 / Mat9-16) TaxID=945713 RepID=I0ALG3_IGNAJ|nr:thymidylate synthase [Ignavibacterium album]AFH49820.1 Thymidylate synthase [Ignavibacterium album JCM 16511]
MKQYHDLVKLVMNEGVRKSSRTGVDTISYFGAFYRVDLSEGFPLLTTKKMEWKSLLYEVLWYLSGEEHIKNLKQHTKIWDAWADENGRLQTAYGRFWRRFPVPDKSVALDGEIFVDENNPFVKRESNGALVFDQVGWVINEIKSNPNSRRLVITAWHPANAVISKLPPCHYTFAFNVSNGKLNCHLTQRSGDIALGIPFNLAAYSILTQIIAQETNLALGYFAHTIIDAHIYVADKGSPTEKYDHLEGLKLQLTREPFPLPQLKIAKKPIDELQFEDFELIGYQHHPKIKFEVAV